MLRTLRACAKIRSGRIFHRFGNLVNIVLSVRGHKSDQVYRSRDVCHSTPHSNTVIPARIAGIQKSTDGKLESRMTKRMWRQIIVLSVRLDSLVPPLKHCGGRL